MPRNHGFSTPNSPPNVPTFHALQQLARKVRVSAGDIKPNQHWNVHTLSFLTSHSFFNLIHSLQRNKFSTPASPPNVPTFRGLQQLALKSTFRQGYLTIKIVLQSFYSTDLSPSDFHLFLDLKKFLRGKFFSNDGAGGENKRQHSFSVKFRSPWKVGTFGGEAGVENSSFLGNASTKFKKLYLVRKLRVCTFKRWFGFFLSVDSSREKKGKLTLKSTLVHTKGNNWHSIPLQALRVNMLILWNENWLKILIPTAEISFLKSW